VTTPRKCAFIGIGGDYPNLGAIANGIGGYSANPLQAGSMPTSLLGTEEPSELARVTTIDPQFAAFTWNSYTDATLINGVALVNSNIRSGGLWRVDSGVATSPFRHTFPTSLTGGVNITGGFGNIDEQWHNGGGADMADGLFVAPTNNDLGYEFRANFNVHLVTPKQGANRGIVFLRMKSVNTPNLEYPVVAVELWESGVKKRLLGARFVLTSTALQNFIFTFDYAELTTPNNVQIKVIGYCDSTSVGGGLAATSKVETLGIYYEDASVTDVADTGWQLNQLRNADPASPAPTTSLDWLYASPVTKISLTVRLLDDQTTHIADALATRSLPIAMAIGSTPDGFVQAGVMPLGPALFLTRGWKPPGPKSRVIVTTDSGTSMAGNPYGSDGFRQRGVSGTFSLDRIEDKLLAELLDWRRGHVGAFWLSADPDLDPAYRQFLAFWATVKERGESLPEEQDYTAATTYLFSKEYDFEERL